MVKVLLADPNPAFSDMIKQVLEETGRFLCACASTGAEATNLARRDPPDIVLMESGLADLSLREAVAAFRQSQPQLPIIVIMPIGEQPLPDAAKYFDLQGMLSKPLYIPQLQSEIEAALQKPVNGVTPAPRAAEPAPAPASAPSQATRPLANPAPKAAPKSAPAWLDDVGRAAQYLTTLTLESSAEAALLMRGQHLVAYAGQASKEDADELARLVANSWATDSASGASGAQVRFIRLAGGADFLVYSTLAADDVVLSMAFQAETPLGQIRKQAKRATEAILSEPKPEPPADVKAQPSKPAPQAAPPQPQQAPQPQSSITDIDLDSIELLTPLPDALTPPARLDQPRRSAQPPESITPDEVPADIDWASFPIKEPTHVPPPIDWVPLTEAASPPEFDLNSLFSSPLDEASPDEPAEPHLAAPNATGVSRPQPDIDLAPIPDPDSLSELSHAILKLERESAVQSPLAELPPGTLAAVRRTPHSLYDLSYTFLILPRIATHLLIGDLRARLEQWLITLADAYDWVAEIIHIEPGHVEISLRTPPSESPDSIVKTIINETSDRILAEFPRLAAEHAQRPGAFWSPGYYAITPGRRLSPEEVQAFIEYQRREQSGGKY